MKLTCLGIALPTALSLASVASAQITNGGFETGFVPASGHGYVPAPWSSTSPGSIVVSFDTWDDSSANGLPPATAGLFTGVSAHGGHRWAGGFNFEDMHQLMPSTLTPGQQYTVSAWVHAPDPAFAYVPGGWQFGLGATSTSTPTIVAVLPATVTWSQGWVFQSATFTAPAGSASMPYFFPQVYKTGSINTYMGIDDIDVRLVPAPGPLALSGLAAVACFRRRRCSHA